MERAEGDDLRRWFADRGLVAEPIAASTPVLFCDEVELAPVTLRRVWHTPLSLSPASRPAADRRSTVVLQTEGVTEWVWADDERAETTRAGDALAYPASVLRAATSVVASARIEIIAPQLPIDGATRLPTADDGPSWRALAAAAKAILGDGARVPPSARRQLGGGIERLCVALIAARAREVSDTSSGGSHELFAAAMAVIHAEAVRADFSVQHLARRLGVSRQYLARIFARQGCSPRDAVQRRRWEVADALLAAGYARDEVVARSGFASARSLDRVRRERGRVPVEAETPPVAPRR
ncbi:helix-turn-helix domain-containing protein [uncultured Microbacterium sp.]|uniref:helix-turn-helix domain-containing protein n=1 Tax=uncultured Microbacterium sp. TaxID=191216 RepID=UPI0025D0B89B|nr:AraC family transcriptional regulator [uncultured Microbacterium sp.]